MHVRLNLSSFCGPIMMDRSIKVATSDDSDSQKNFIYPQQRHQETPIETLLEPIRYSMAFLTLFSIISTIIVAILLVPLESLQLLAQFLSLIVSLSGLFGTMRRSILLSSIYALAMLLFLFLQSSYFFVLLKLVQEVKMNNNDNSQHEKFWQLSSASTTTTTTATTSATTDATNNGGANPTTGDNHQQQNDLATPNTALSVANWYSTSVSDRVQSNSNHHHYWIKKKRMKKRIRDQKTIKTTTTIITTTSATSTTPKYKIPPYYNTDNDEQYQLPSSSAHVRRITRILNEELSYLSLLTVPMIAWLPPSLFMETVAVLILTMQALAGACFLYALHRSEPYRKCRFPDDDGDGYHHIKLPIYMDYT